MSGRSRLFEWECLQAESRTKLGHVPVQDREEHLLDLILRRAPGEHVNDDAELVPVMIQVPDWERTFPDVGGITIPYADPRSGRAIPVYLTQREAAQMREANEQRWEMLTRDFRSLGVEPVDGAVRTG